jgi:hypothetical protein
MTMLRSLVFWFFFFLFSNFFNLFICGFAMRVDAILCHLCHLCDRYAIHSQVRSRASTKSTRFAMWCSTCTKALGRSPNTLLVCTLGRWDVFFFSFYFLLSPYCQHSVLILLPYNYQFYLFRSSFPLRFRYFPLRFRSFPLRFRSFPLRFRYFPLRFRSFPLRFRSFPFNFVPFPSISFFLSIRFLTSRRVLCECESEAHQDGVWP